MLASPDTESGSLVIIGCGGASEMLPTILPSIGPTSRVILIDPMANAAESLPDALQESAPDQILAVPGNRAGKTEVTFYSLPGLVGLGEHTDALTALLPGLRERSRHLVDRVSGKNLASKLGDLPEPVTCLIDLPGGEAEIIDSLASAGLLQRISALSIRCGVETYFTGALTSEAVEKLLIDNGFSLRREITDDPDWPQLSFTADPRARRLAKFEADVKSLSAKLSNRELTLRKARADLKKQAKLIDQLDAEVTSLKQKLEKQTRELEQTVSALADRGSSLEATSQELNEVKKLLSEKTAALRETEEKLSQATTDLDAASLAFAGIQAQHDEATHKLASLERELVERDENLGKAYGDLEVLKKDLEKKQALLEDRNRFLAEQSAEIVKRDKLLLETRKELDEKRSLLNDQDVELESRRTALESKNEALASRDRILADANEALADSQKILAEKVEALSAATETLQKLEAALAEQQSSHAQMEVETAAQRSKLDELSRTAEERAKKAEQLAGQLAEREAVIEELQAKLAVGDVNLKEHKDRISDLETRLATASPAQELAERRAEQAISEQVFQSRVNAMMQVDLEKLRARFESSEIKRRKLEELLRKLTPKLMQASEHLHQLKLVQAEDTDTMEQEVSEVSSSRSGSGGATAKKGQSAGASEQGV